MSKASLGQRRDFRALFDELDGVALWTATDPGKFDYISAGFEDIWGTPSEKVKDEPADVSRDGCRTRRRTSTAASIPTVVCVHELWTVGRGTRNPVSCVVAALTSL